MRNRIAIVTAAGITMLLAAGTGLALASTPPARVPADVVPVVSAPAPDLTTSTSTLAPAPMDPAVPGTAEPEISADEAASIALARVGGGRVTEIEREYEHGRREWKVEITDGSREHDIRVDATTGQITRTDVDDRN